MRKVASRRFENRLLEGAVSLCTAFVLLAAPVVAQTAGSGTPEGGVNPANELNSRSNSLKMQMLGPQMGLVTNKADTLRTGEYAAVLDNLHMLKDGIWSSRGTGWTRHRSTAFNSGASMLGFAQHVNNSTPPAEVFLFQAGDKLYTYVLSTATETLIYTANSATAAPCFLSYNQNALIWVNGLSQPRVWPGTGSTSTIGTFPAAIGSYSNINQPAFVERLGTRTVWARFGVLTYGANANIQHQMVLFSNDASTGSAFNFTTTVPAAATDAGYIAFASKYGTVRGIKVIRLRDGNNTEILLVGLDKALGVITGSSALNFTGSIVSTEFGVPSNNTWAQVGDDTYFLASDGVRRLRSISGDAGGFTPELITQPIQDVINRINWTYANTAWSMYNPETQELVFWVPIDSDTTPKNAIVLNFQRDRDKPLFSTLSQQKLVSGAFVNGVAYGGTSDGYLETLWTGDDYDGTTIAWEYLSAISGASSPAQNASNRKFQIITDGSNQQFTARAYTFTQRQDGVTQLKLQATKSVAVTKPSITKLGTWASGSTTSYSQFTDFPAAGSGRFWLCRLTGASSGDHIDLVGVLDVLQVGGLKQ